MPTLELTHVRKTFGPTVALESLDLALHDGEFVSLLGPSGCGKTTALRIVAGFEASDSGHVRLDDNDISHVPAHQRDMGMVFQSYSLFPHLSVLDNVAFGLKMRRRPRTEQRARANEMIELVGLAEQAKRYPHQLSGGQQQRVALARALAVGPKVLLLDEPLSALDAKVRVALRDEIRRLQRELGITTLFVTHDQEEALAVSDRVGVMSNGRLEQLGTPMEVYNRPATPFVARFVGSVNTLDGIAQLGGVALPTGFVRVHGDLPADGTEVRLLVRPEAWHVTLDAGATATPSLPAQVIAQSFLGATTRLTVALTDGTSLLVDVPSDRAAEVPAGGRVGLAVGDDGVFVEPR